MRSVGGNVLAAKIATTGLLFFFLSAFSANLFSATDSDLSKTTLQRYAAQRALFLDLRDALTQGQVADAASQRAGLSGYPLEYYFDYLLLRQRIKGSKQPSKYIVAARRHFRQWTDQRLYKRLLGAIKNRHVKLSQWRAYAELLKIEDAPHHPCDDLYAKVSNGLLEQMDTTAAELWVRPVVHRDNCAKAFAVLTKNRPVPVASLWQRSGALIQKGYLEEAAKLLHFFNSRDRARLQFWMDSRDRAAEAVATVKPIHDETDRAILLDLLALWAREDLPAVSRYLQVHARKHGLDAEVSEKLLGNYAVRAAKSNLPEAAKMLAAVAAPSKTTRFWRIRTAMRAANWQAVLNNIEQLPEDEKASSRWRYWRARALREVGDERAAKKEFTQLASLFEYHGFLAADQLGKSYALFSQTPVVEAALLGEMLARPLLLQAIEFHLVNVSWEGRRSWRLALQDASADEYIAASAIATAIGWSDRALKSMQQADQPLALDALYPTPYLSRIRDLAARHSLAQELVYGLIKQESGFVVDIRSSAGAVGLMQLMPATAKQMGRELGMRVQPWRLTNHELNIQLGVRYLQHVMDKFSHNTVLAMAAYNAGPHRVKRWAPKKSMAADVWVETIPFDETRGYVKNVLFNSTVAQWRLENGYTSPLSSRMPDIVVTRDSG